VQAAAKPLRPSRQRLIVIASLARLRTLSTLSGLTDLPLALIGLDGHLRRDFTGRVQDLASGPDQVSHALQAAALLLENTDWERPSRVLVISTSPPADLLSLTVWAERLALQNVALDVWTSKRSSAVWRSVARQAFGHVQALEGDVELPTALKQYGQAWNRGAVPDLEVTLGAGLVGIGEDWQARRLRLGFLEGGERRVIRIRVTPQGQASRPAVEVRFPTLGYSVRLAASRLSITGAA